MIWHPISTAPKIGRILLWHPKIGPAMGDWCPTQKRWRLDWWLSMGHEWQLRHQPTHWARVVPPKDAKPTAATRGLFG